jgi:hypothetical protein
MRKAPTLIVVLLTVLLTGCVLNGKKPVAVATVTPKPAPTPPPAPPQPLSIPQTQVELPKPQAIPEGALDTEQPPVEAPPEPPKAPASSSTTRRSPTVNTSPPATTAAPPAQLPSNAAPNEPAAPTIGEIVPAADLKRFQDEAIGRRKEVAQILTEIGRRRPTTAQHEAMIVIDSFLNSSLDAEKKGDMRLANTFAERALIKAKDLLNAK